MINVIIEEMAKGNFSFAILVVGTGQLIVMIKNYLEQKKHNKEKENEDIEEVYKPKTDTISLWN